MAADLSRAATAAGLLALLPLASLAAPPLADPTRPPAFAAPAAEGAGRSAGPARGAVALPAPPPASAPVLQSLQLGPGQASALVDGRLLRVGDRLGQRTLVAIDAQGLTLRTEAGRSERLELLSGVVKHAVGAAPGNASVQARLHGVAAAPVAAPSSSSSAGRTPP